ncbi:hypothetical protein A8H39_00115 [Paraburkholderia fungorum]|uniref:hypothetical protein n=1 Tax=Paraburkholderia fungorum TaxID=134537 RepID=UPI0004811373|nr:hypothetical protein [Paraburkholderia fungorum]MBB5546528.1 hypothetical protein [Paraburkholderia fungorum]PNE59590.1 hypothetical protein A8H39_00115 [Paraburkholderia fungorum]
MNRNIQSNTEQPKTHLQMLQDVVAAQVRLWDALRVLEKATAPDGDYSDKANDEVIEYVKSLAVGLDGADEAYTRVIDEHLKKALSLSSH